MKKQFMILPLVILLFFAFSCQRGEELAEEAAQAETAHYAVNKGVRIHYEIVSSGPPLVLQHGWANSLEYWRDFGYTEVLKKDYKLILIDARGHGKSDIPKNPEVYDTSFMAYDVIAVLDHLIAYVRSDLVLPPIIQFLDGKSQKFGQT